MLTRDGINENRERFQELMEQAAGERHGYRAFMGWLEETDFYEAPASTKYHGNESGGLLQHSINVYDRLRMRKCRRIHQKRRKGMLGDDCSATS